MPGLAERVDKRAGPENPGPYGSGSDNIFHFNAYFNINSKNMKLYFEMYLFPTATKSFLLNTVFCSILKCQWEKERAEKKQKNGKCEVLKK